MIGADRTFGVRFGHGPGHPVGAPARSSVLLGIAKALALTGAGALIAGFFVFAISIERNEPVLLRRAQGVVALTGGADRITDALDLLATGQAERLLITGVNQATSGREIAHLTPRLRPLFSCCIDLGYRALNTVGNAAETRRWVHQHGMRSLIVVTSNYHMPRALIEIGRALPGIELVPYPVVTERQKSGSWWADPGMLRLLATEYVKYLAAYARAELVPEPSADADLEVAAARPT
jgi:uncharacterized SAM-binding protein YcdF (DUF218 family)